MDRLLSRVVVNENGCWIYTGSCRSGGYGQIHEGGRLRTTHRVSYELFVGPIPEGLQIDHLCRVRRCCNPDHLEAVTQRENLMRGVGLSAQNAVKTECHRGHAFDAENTYTSPKNQRFCRECRRQRSRRYADEKRAA